VVATALLVGCSNKSTEVGSSGDDFQGTEVIWADDGGEGAGGSSAWSDTGLGPTEDVTLTELDTSCDPDAGASGSALVVAGGAGDIVITHIGVSDRCCAEWSPRAESRGSIIQVTYADTGADSCDCTCPWEFNYTLVELAAGEWTVTASGDEATVTVLAP